MNDLIIVGFSGSHKIETWHPGDEDMCQRLCERIVRNTGHTVWVIRGTIEGRYEPEEMPVKFIKGTQFSTSD